MGITMNVITLGTFDVFHRGHIELLKKCRKIAGKGGFVVVGLNTDEFITKYKGKPPILDYTEREKTLFASDLVDYIIPNNQEDGSAKSEILKSCADLIVIGSDWARKDYVAQLGIDWDWLDDMNIGICYVNYTKDISTTEIKKRIKDA